MISKIEEIQINRVISASAGLLSFIIVLSPQLNRAKTFPKLSTSTIRSSLTFKLDKQIIQLPILVVNNQVWSQIYQSIPSIHKRLSNKNMEQALILQNGPTLATVKYCKKIVPLWRWDLPAAYLLLNSCKSRSIYRNHLSYSQVPVNNIISIGLQGRGMDAIVLTLFKVSLVYMTCKATSNNNTKNFGERLNADTVLTLV